MSKDHSHFSSISGLTNISTDHVDYQARFDRIMEDLQTQAANTFEVWSGAGQDNYKVANREFNSRFEEVQEAFSHLISSTDEVTDRMRNMHTRLDNLF